MAPWETSRRLCCLLWVGRVAAVNSNAERSDTGTARNETKPSKETHENPIRESSGIVDNLKMNPQSWGQGGGKGGDEGRSQEDHSGKIFMIT